jgi:CrcB protein
MMPKQALLVAAGAVPGAWLRFLLVNHLAERLPSKPWGTLIVNLLACFVLGWILPGLQRPGAPPEASLLLVTGFLGSLSTFSTLMVELLTVRALGPLVRLVFGSLVGGFLALMVGLILGR